MILKLNNQSKNFYTHLGKFFGSRDIERVTHDRIFDDDDKEWYIKFNRSGKPVAFVSIAGGKVKNIWGDTENNIVEVLKKVKDESEIKNSIVTTAFKELYSKAGYEIEEHSKNFVVIRSCENEED